jgi:hypothetical protein
VVTTRPIAPHEWDVILGITIAACGLQSTVRAHLSICRATVERLAARTADLARESELRAKLLTTLLDGLEAPLCEPARPTPPSGVF